jgi:type III secretory pathway lipoprotein EscJ
MRLLLLLSLTSIACSGGVPVAQDRTEGEATHIAVVLMKDGHIHSAIRRQESSHDPKYDVLVDRSDVDEASRIIDAHHLLADHRPTSKDVWIDQSGLIPTPKGDHARLVMGMEGDIETKFRGMPRVIDAHALASVPEKEIAIDPSEVRPKPKVSTTITYVEDESGVPPISVEEAQRMIASKVEGVSPNDVFVKFIPIPQDKRPEGQGCEKTRTLGIEVCADSRGSLMNLILGTVVGAGVLAAGLMVSALRTMRYRRDLTRLTAEIEKKS